MTRGVEANGWSKWRDGDSLKADILAFSDNDGGWAYAHPPSLFE
ncbi:hypothetical protein AB4520_03415 [Vibrio renipiscarius]